MPANPTVQSDISSADIFDAHLGGKLAVESSVALDTARDLSIAYTPGAPELSRAVHADTSIATTHTWAARLVAGVSDGTAVLGLGNIGPSASSPVMKERSALFKAFGPPELHCAGTEHH